LEAVYLFRVFNEYLSRVRVITDDIVRQRMDDFFEEDKDIIKATINVNYNKFVVDIVMNEFTVDNADLCFRSFVAKVAYPYSSLWTRYNEGNRVCYRFLTSNENKTAVYMNIMFS
jgi:hypothetical protein